MTPEHARLEEDRQRVKHWKRWGPYLSERAWGTVREDYSANGNAWEYFPHEHARSRAYRWNEDGIGGICDRHQRICFSLALWNERDPFLKERMFGLTGREGNHGEDVKEYYFYLDSTPTHSYMRFLYKYPHERFPYASLPEANRNRTRDELEYELADTGIFNQSRYFDVVVEYAKASPEDLFVQITATNRGPESAPLHLLPTIWFRNTWSWTDTPGRPSLQREAHQLHPSLIALDEPYYGRRWLHCEGSPELLFTENDTNLRIFGARFNGFSKDGVDSYVVQGRTNAVNSAQRGTKASAHYARILESGEEWRLRLRFSDMSPDRVPTSQWDEDLVTVFEDRRREADQFFGTVIPETLSPDERQVMRQALAGVLWSKQFYHYVVKTWLDGDPTQPLPPPERRQGRNVGWGHLFNADVISMPDKWEYPWYAAWDLAFHCIPLVLVDPEFAKQQLLLMLREWYMHPNGQLPAYEWALGDVNPPVYAWAAWRIYKIEKRRTGRADLLFLERVFQKLLLNFNWWVNRKDDEGRNVFQGGFLGLDNISVFDRNVELPTGGHLEQSDGTSWMAMYCLNMLAIAIELSNSSPAYEDMASKFWEHFLYIAAAMRNRGGQDDVGMWDDVDGWFYDVLHLPTGRLVPLKVRSAVGLIPLFAVETLEPERLADLKGFSRRLQWFVENRKDLTSGVASMTRPGSGKRRLLAIVSPAQLRRVLQVLLDESEFLSPFGIRALSRFHTGAPYELMVREEIHSVAYEPGESRSCLFGGNSNWRGPVWLPINFLIIESLQKFHHYFGDAFTVECPTGSGRQMTLRDVAAEISRRVSTIFIPDGSGRRPLNGGVRIFDEDPHWRNCIPFFEYFHGETGRGAGASHQTGWTALVAKLLQQMGEERCRPTGNITISLRL